MRKGKHIYSETGQFCLVNTVTLAKGFVFVDVFSQAKKHIDVNNMINLKAIFDKDTDYFVRIPRDELTRRFELPTSSLPRKCSTPELRQLKQY